MLSTGPLGRSRRALHEHDHKLAAYFAMFERWGGARPGADMKSVRSTTEPHDLSASMKVVIWFDPMD